MRDLVEVVGCGFYPGIALNQFEDVDQIGAHVVQLGLGVVAGADTVERPLDEPESLFEGVMQRAGH